MSKSTIEELLSTESLINSISEGLCIFGASKRSTDLEFIVWNKQMEKLTGYTMEEINKKGWRCLFISNAKEITEGLNVEFLFDDAEERLEKEYHILTKHGMSKIVSADLSRIQMNNGKSKILVLMKDITEKKYIEQELREVEERYSKILEFSTDAVFIHHEGKIIYANPGAVKLLGTENAGEIVGQNILKFVHPDFYGLVAERIRLTQEYEASLPIVEEKFLNIKGDTLYVEVAVTSLPFGGRKYHLVSVRDISDRKLMENALKESEAMLRQVTENTLDLISICDKHGIVRYATPSHYNITGYKPEELMGTSPVMLVQEDELPYVKECFRRMKENGEVVKIQYRCICKDGSLKNLEICGKPLYCNNLFDGYVLSSRDISDRVKAEEALKRSEERYRFLVESLPFGVFVRTRERILFCNEAGLSYLGVKNMDEVCGRPFSQMVVAHPEYVQQYESNLKQFELEGYLPPTEEKYIRLSDNKVLDLESVAVKWNYDNVKDAYLVVIRDISDRRKAEELERNMTEKSRLLKEAFEYEKLRTEFFANISHELRTPINVIFSTIQLLNMCTDRMNLSSSSTAKLKKYMTIMKQNCYRLIRLVNNLIDASRIDSGFFDLNLSNNEIVSIIEDIVLSVAEYIEGKNISLIFDTDIEEKMMACDPDKIERIMLNLISNAVKFTENGGSILVNVFDRGERLKISVKDTGIGISQDKQKFIFERFVQVDKSLTRSREGSGIGLSLVKALVEMHNGNITVKSEPGLGSEFIVELPAVLIQEEEDRLETQRLSAQAKIEKIDIEFSDIY